MVAVRLVFNEPGAMLHSLSSPHHVKQDEIVTGDHMPKEQSDEMQAAKETNEPRVVANGLEAALGRRYPVLSGGFVRAVDYMGTDASIVQAARVSYGDGTRALHEDR